MTTSRVPEARVTLLSTEMKSPTSYVDGAVTDASGVATLRLSGPGAYRIQVEHGNLFQTTASLHWLPARLNLYSR